MIPAESLFHFLDAPGGSFSCKKNAQTPWGERFLLTSQTWRGTPWEHPLWWTQPEHVLCRRTALLYLTGDEVPDADGPDVVRLANAVGLPTATLFQLPVQPLWEMREDDLIAHTLERCIESGDASWPLLFPMVRAATAAMDAVQQFAPHIERFIVTGASKRGWTAWLVGCLGDSRVAGLAPQVYDNLNLPAQMEAQRLSFQGGMSPKLEDYSRRELQQLLQTPEGLALGRAIDPFTHRHRVTAPVWMIHGANDAFWPVDAARHYLPFLQGKCALTAIPNVGHDLGDRRQSHAAVGALARHVVLGVPLPPWRELEGGTHWHAESESRDFSQSVWTSLPGSGPYRANLTTLSHSIDGHDFVVSSIPEVEEPD